jgi:hypothetical protein
LRDFHESGNNSTTVSEFDYLQRKILMSRRRLSIIIILLLIICCAGAVAIVVFTMEQEKAEIRDKYGEDVAKLCEEPGGGAADPANLTSADAQIKFLILTDEGMYHDWHDKLPVELRAKDKDELDAVICLQSSSKEIERCPYVDPKDESKTLFTIVREQPLVDVVLLNPAGARIAEFTLSGGMPDECSDEARGTKDSVQKQRGKAVSYNDLYTALTEFTAP